MPKPRGLALAPIFALIFGILAVAGCSLAGGNLLGGREKCWPESERRAASLWRGVLEIDAAGARLATPEGEVIPLLPGALTIAFGEDGTGELVGGGAVVARAGNDVTLFGGAGADGALVMCAIEELHAP